MKRYIPDLRYIGCGEDIAEMREWTPDDDNDYETYVLYPEAQARIEALEAILRQVGEATGCIGDDGVCPVCHTYSHKSWCWYPALVKWDEEQAAREAAGV